MKIPPDMKIGSVFQTKTSGKLRVVRYHGWKSVEVEFIATGYKTSRHASQIRVGEVKDLLHKSVIGVGYIGIGRHKPSKSGKHSKAYRTWKHMIERCYSQEIQDKFPSYKGCTVCEEWHCFNSYADWHEENYPNDGVNYHLDKDIIIDGNKEYRPDACMFVTQSQNNIKAKAKTYKLKSPSGDIVEIYNMSAFARENGILQSGLHAVWSGLSISYKGWKRA